jgi:predicted alpha/beta superfamily hydrolase
MRKLLLISFLFLSVQSFCQAKDNRVTIGTKESLYSKVLDENRDYEVYLPPSYNRSNKNLKFPVLYLLDGDGHFHSVSGLVQQLAGGVNGNTLFPEMIIIAINNTDRTRDLTPVHDAIGPDGKEVPFLKTSGGGENFVKFLQMELIPEVELKYNTAPYRLLVGHSFGGLTAINILLNHTELFNAYIAIDPSMWWAKRALLKQAEEILPKKNFKGHSLYLAIANTMPYKMSFENVDRDSSGTTEHIRAIKALVSLGERNKSNGLRFSWQYFNDDDHGSVPLIAEYYGLRFLFDNYRMNEAKATAGIDSLVAHYQMVSDMMGYTILPPENLVNQIGYLYLQAGETDKAMAHFALNIKNYPNSSNVYDSMGDAYLAKGEKAKAKEEFQRALRVDPLNAGSKEKLEKLK